MDSAGSAVGERNPMSRLKGNPALPRLLSLVAVAGCLLGALATTDAPRAAAAGPKTLVVAGRSIGGVKLRETRRAVQRGAPLGLHKPTKTAKHGPGKLLTQTYTHDGAQILITYRRRGLAGRVIYVTSGKGPWHTREGVQYGASILQGAAVGIPGSSEYGCYYHNADGSWTLDPEPEKAQICQSEYLDPRRFFLMSFGAVGTQSDPAVLVGFGLSVVRLI